MMVRALTGRTSAALPEWVAQAIEVQLRWPREYLAAPAGLRSNRAPGPVVIAADGRHGMAAAACTEGSARWFPISASALPARRSRGVGRGRFSTGTGSPTACSFAGGSRSGSRLRCSGHLLRGIEPAGRRPRTITRNPVLPPDPHPVLLRRSQ